MTGGAQWRAKVLARRTSGRFTVLTVSAPGVAERCRPGHYASVSVADDGSAMLMRRQVWIANSSASGRDGGAIELVVDSAQSGGALLRAVDQGVGLDLIGPLGRPFSLPRTAVAAVVVGEGAAAAPLIWLAAELGVRGSRVRFVYLADDELFGQLDAKRVSAAVATLPDDADIGAAVARELAGAEVLYSAGAADRITPVALAAGTLPHQAALQTELVCGAATCTACVIPITGRDEVARMVRACTEGPVFNAGLVRWSELGSIPVDCLGPEEVVR